MELWCKLPNKCLPDSGTLKPSEFTENKPCPDGSSRTQSISQACCKGTQAESNDPQTALKLHMSIPKISNRNQGNFSHIAVIILLLVVLRWWWWGRRRLQLKIRHKRGENK